MSHCIFEPIGPLDERVARLLDDVMPEFDVNEVHAIRVSAPRDAAYAAAKGVTPREVRLLGPLMAIRTLPSTLRGARRAPPPGLSLIDTFLANGFVLLGERPGNEIVIGAIGRFWRLSGTIPMRAPGTAAEFVEFSGPGYAKAATNLYVEPDGPYTRIVTETRVIGTDVQAAKSFRRYWFFIRGGSGLIRRSWLAGIRRRLALECGA